MTRLNEIQSGNEIICNAHSRINKKNSLLSLLPSILKLHVLTITTEIIKQQKQFAKHLKCTTICESYKALHSIYSVIFSIHIHIVFVVIILLFICIVYGYVISCRFKTFVKQQFPFQMKSFRKVFSFKSRMCRNV